MGFYKITRVVLRSLVKKPATYAYPNANRTWHERTRGRVRLEEKDCILCGICAKKCPTDAIKVNREERTWTIERMSCVLCGSCVEFCPKKCLIMANQFATPYTEKTVDVVKVPEAAPAETVPKTIDETPKSE
jgi:formate hydrogenlyase subunit 6/NADH:ubiquinone oxidoreductase subunit I